MNILNFITTDATLSMPITTYEALLEKVVLDERQRIIKLLEFYLGETDWSNFEGDSPSVEWIRGFSAALALIKGENK